jgi:pSer/pThr/pTyr-binding forkhead associated (FHA) protein
MKVQLIVVRGKPEGKVIPLSGTNFKIGRGETCHLRPNSEQVSREHAEFTIESSTVIVRDLGSRNGTLVNGKALTTEACKLKDRDLVQVGPLTFAVSIIQDASASPPRQVAPPAEAAALASAQVTAKAKPSPDDISTDDIDSWLLGDNASQSADQPTAVYGGDTITIAAFKDAQASAKQPSKPPSVADDSEYERQTAEAEASSAEETLDEIPVDSDEGAEGVDEEEDEEEDEEADEKNLEDEFMDPSNPFYAAKKAQKEQAKGASAAAAAGAANATFKDSSDAANEILRKLMERRRASKS